MAESGFEEVPINSIQLDYEATRRMVIMSAITAIVNLQIRSLVISYSAYQTDSSNPSPSSPREALGTL